MTIYEHKKITLWRITAKLLRSIVNLFSLWPLLLVVAIIFSPISPHLRWEYTYRGEGAFRVYYSCRYVGADGFVNYMRGEECPFITLIQRH